ncbi:MAG: hypothetical protein ABIF82_11310 [Planctomycetota bacterium]
MPNNRSTEPARARLFRRESRVSDAPLGGVVAAEGRFALDESGEEVDVRPGGGGGLLGHVLEVVQDELKLEISELVAQRVRVRCFRVVVVLAHGFLLS